MKNGPDVSYWQDNNETDQQINFDMMKMAGMDFVIIRAGQNKWADPDFAYNWSRAKQAQLLRGSYWYYDSRVSPESQATLWANLLASDHPEMEVWLDLEEVFGGPYTGYVHWKRFIVKFKSLMPDVKIGIYTSYGFISGKIPMTEWSFFSMLPLWLAWWTKNPNGEFYPHIEQVQIPKPWTSMLFWQWGTPSWGMKLGCESVEIDMNQFVLTDQQFDERYELPDDGGNGDENMAYMKLTPSVAGEYRSIRNETNYPTVPHILGFTSSSQRIFPNNFAKADLADFYVYAADVVISGVVKAKAGDKWWKVYEANGGPMSGWVAEKHLGVTYLTVEQVGDVPPPDGVHQTWNIKVMSDGSIELTGGGGLTINGIPYE